MEMRNYLCLFDLDAYDKRVAPALRMYARQFDPKDSVALLREAVKSARSGIEDFEHWIVSLEPDKGYKPSDQTVRELADMLIRIYCLPREPVQLDQFRPWLSAKSAWFENLMDGGEELAGGSLEFTLGAGRLVATQEQSKQFHEETAVDPPPDLAGEFRRLRELLDLAIGNKAYTLLKTSWLS